MRLLSFHGVCDPLLPFRRPAVVFRDRFALTTLGRFLGYEELEE